ncbi:putative membrane protein YphA (DoxX/SURF4 family) [Neobacillus bataviensis]|uniref:Putative membrane protein YphA (DoxX/SURF4 family) n=1 Tax=Neobacillus bataviensis TaxID=220685 RepID=A0A561DE83_9BACI|nr:DoxX family protein [Neobacillus bataviensis]TWE01716.1 putative membrane protein YphA (DoxX/SURF4 family) [Neobacillus bataviensis]
MLKKFEASTLILRVVVGITFFVHGVVKFQGGIENIVGWFGAIGLPGFLAYVVATIEVVGGIALILGLGSRVVAALLALLMVGATLKVKLAVGFLGNGEMAGYELDLALLAMSVFIAINGSKMFALDQVIFKGQKTDTKSF